MGSDFGGSIRYPAHICGVCGIKPTAGRVPRTGHIFPFGGIQDAFQQIGPLARSVDDLALLLPLIMGPDGVDPYAEPLVWGEPDAVDVGGLRVACFADDGVASASPETRAAVAASARVVADAGARVEETRPEAMADTLDIALPVYFWDGGAAIQRLLDAAGTTEHTLEGVISGNALSPDELGQAIERLDDWRSRMLGFMARYDVLICPVNAEAAFLAGSPLDDAMMARASFAIAFNVTGWPAVAVPAGRTAEGLPIGVQVVASPGREDRALAVARVIEQGLGGYRRPEGI